MYTEGKTKEAIDHLRRAVLIDKTDGDAWYYLGLALVRQDDIKAARNALSEAVKLKPEFAPAHTALAYALMGSSRDEAAEREARSAIDLNSNDAMAHYILGVVHLRYARIQDADREADIAILQRPGFGPAYLLKSQALVAIQGEQSARFSRVLSARDPKAPLSEEEKQRRRENAQKSVQLFAAAAGALEKYLKLVDSDSGTAVWKGQLETLRTFARQSQTRIYSGSEVTTKARVLSKPEPVYTSQARSAGITGTVILRAVFTAYGTVENILVLKSLPGGMTGQCVEAARRIRFTPATKDGQPVSMIMELQYNFNLY